MPAGDPARLIDAIARLIAALAWPSALVIALLLLRASVRDFIATLSEVRLKGAGFEAWAQRKLTLDAAAQKLYDFWKPGGKTDRTNAGKIVACMAELGIGGSASWLIHAGAPEDRIRVVARLSREARGETNAV